MFAEMSKLFATLLIMLGIAIHNYLDVPTKLFSDLFS